MNKEIFLTYKGILLGQTPKIVDVFKQRLGDFNRIIEIGSNRGGFALFLHDNKNEDADLISYEIKHNTTEVPKNIKLDFRIGDCFSHKIMTEIKDLINDETKKILLLCDGGNKVKEFNTFSAFLKPNDVIMCHDYAHNINDFEKIKKELNWHSRFESSYDEIYSAVKNNGLDKYYYDEFKSVLWGSFIKK